MDKAWKNLSRAWKDLSRAWTGVPGFSTNFNVFFLGEIGGSPSQKLGNNLIGNKLMQGMMDMFALISSHADGLTKTSAWVGDGGKIKGVKNRQHKPRLQSGYP